MNYTQALIPKQYHIREVHYYCLNCSAEFIVRYPIGNELVKYVDATNAGDERWLPTYEAGGYLELVERLVDRFSQDKPITMDVSRDFEAAFALMQEPGHSGRPFKLFVKTLCPKCNGTDLRVEQEKVLDTPELKWMKYRSNLQA